MMVLAIEKGQFRDKNRHIVAIHSNGIVCGCPDRNCTWI